MNCLSQPPCNPRPCWMQDLHVECGRPSPAQAIRRHGRHTQAIWRHERHTLTREDGVLSVTTSLQPSALLGARPARGLRSLFFAQATQAHPKDAMTCLSQVPFDPWPCWMRAPIPVAAALRPPAPGGWGASHDGLSPLPIGDRETRLLGPELSFALGPAGCTFTTWMRSPVPAHR